MTAGSRARASARGASRGGASRGRARRRRRSPRRGRPRRAGVAVERRSGVPSAIGEHARAEADHGRDARARAARIAACEVAPPRGGGDAHDELGVERRGLAGREVVGDQDPGSRRRRRRRAGQLAQHAPADVVDVGGALAQLARRRGRRARRRPAAAAPRQATRRGARRSRSRRAPARASSRRRAAAPGRRRSAASARRRAAPRAARELGSRAPASAALEPRRSSSGAPAGSSRRSGSAGLEPAGRADREARRTAATPRSSCRAPRGRPGRRRPRRASPRAGGDRRQPTARRRRASPKSTAASLASAAERAAAAGPRRDVELVALRARRASPGRSGCGASAGPRPAVALRDRDRASWLAASCDDAARPAARAGRARCRRAGAPSRRSPDASEGAASPRRRPRPSCAAFGGQRAAGLGRDLGERRARARRAPPRRRRPPPAALGQQHARPPSVEHLERHLGAHDARCRGPSARARRRGGRARSIAAITRIGVGADRARRRARRPASIATSSPPISRASSTTPSASRALCETMTRPTIAASGRP